MEETTFETEDQTTEMTANRTEPPPAVVAKRWPLWLRIAVLVLLALAFVLPLLIFREQFVRIFAMREQVVEEVRAAGAWGPLVIIGLAIGQTIVAPIPGQVVNFVAGYVYGLGPGMLYSWIGLVLGTSLAMLLARYAGRPVVERIVGQSLLDRVDRAAAGRGLSFFVLCFLIPGLPDDILCFVAGLTTLPLRALVLVAAIARIPGLLGSALLGAYASSMPIWGWILLTVLSLVATYLAWKYGERAQEWLLKRINVL